MLLLTSTTDRIRIVTSSAADLHVHASYADYTSTGYTLGSNNTVITSAATTDNIVAAPGASTQRNVKNLNVRNKHASTANDVTIQLYNGTTVYELFKCTLAAGEVLTFNDAAGFQVFNTAGALKNTTLNAADVSVRVYHSLDQSLTSSTALALAFNSERWDTHAMHDTVTNPSRLTCIVPGKHDIKGHVSFDANNSGARQIYIRLNGSTILAVMDLPPVAGQEMDVSVATAWDMAAGDYVELIAYQTSGSTLNAKAHGSYSPEFMMTHF